MAKVRHKKVHHPRHSSSLLGSSFFGNNTDGRLRLAAVAFITIGVSFFLWQIGMLPGPH